MFTVLGNCYLFEMSLKYEGMLPHYHLHPKLHLNINQITIIPAKRTDLSSNAAAVARSDEEIGHCWVGRFASSSAVDPKGGTSGFASALCFHMRAAACPKPKP
jgi:hypothetical protein